MRSPSIRIWLIGLVTFAILCLPGPAAATDISSIVRFGSHSKALYYFGVKGSAGKANIAILYVEFGTDGKYQMWEPGSPTHAEGRATVSGEPGNLAMRLVQRYPFPDDSVRLNPRPGPDGMILVTEHLALYPSVSPVKRPPPVSGKVATFAEARARFSIDDDTYNAAWEVLRINQRPARPAAIIIGNSGVREDINVAQLSQSMGRPVYKLGFNGATIFEILLVYRKLRISPGDLVVVFFHPGDLTRWFSAGPQKSILPVDWAKPHEAIAQSRQAFRVFLDPISASEYAGYLSSTTPLSSVKVALSDLIPFYRMREIFETASRQGFKPEPWVEFRYTGRLKGPIAAMKAITAPYPAIARPDNTRLDSDNLALRILRQISADVVSRGAVPLIVEMPTDPAVAGPAFSPEIRADLEALVPDIPLVFLPSNLLSDIPHFVDHNHLSPKGRQVFTAWLGRELPAQRGQEVATAR